VVTADSATDLCEVDVVAMHAESSVPRDAVDRRGTQVPRLLHFRVSHYNEKVRWALDHKRWPHVREAQVPGFHVAKVRWTSGQSQLPVLRLEGRTLFGSSRILAELERLRPEPPLYPEDPAERARALAIEAWFDEHVAPDVRRLFWAAYIDDAAACAAMATDGFSAATRRVWRALFPLMRPPFRRNMGVQADQLAAARKRLPGYFDRLESEIGRHGFLVGERFGIADLAAAAVMTAIIRPPEFPYPLPEPWPQALVELRQSVAHRAGFRWVLDVYARHRGASSEIAPASR
jgi:glutathione S-transferase